MPNTSPRLELTGDTHRFAPNTATDPPPRRLSVARGTRARSAT